MIILIVLQIAAVTGIVVKSSVFLSDVVYDSKVLNISGQPVKGVTALNCNLACFNMIKCVSYAVNVSTEMNSCILYETNLCNVSSKVSLVTKDGYRMFDKVNPTNEENHRSCHFKQDRYRICLEKEKAKNASYKQMDKSDGCPLGFSFHDGVCYKLVVEPKRNYFAAHNLSTDPVGSGLIKFRDQGALLFLRSLMTKQQVYGAYIGLRNRGGGNKSSADWRWEDGTPTSVPDPTGILQWDYPQPDYVPESVVLMKPPDYCWSDESIASNVQFICQTQVSSKGTCPSGSTLYKGLNSTKICYALTPNGASADYAAILCRQLNTPSNNYTVATIRNADQWNFLVGLIRKSFPSAAFAVGVNYRVNQWCDASGAPYTISQFGQWCNGEPDRKPQACAATYNEIRGMPLDDGYCSQELPYAKEWIASSCLEWYHLGHNTSNGLFRIRPKGAQVDFQVYCDMTNEGGGWTVIQRNNGNADSEFLRGLNDYDQGFGNVTSNFWLGLDQMFFLTSQEDTELSLSLTDTSGRQYSIQYSKFKLFKTGQSSYFFHVNNFKTASELTDEFGSQQNAPFKADSRKGGWWFASGSTVNLNGKSGDDNATIMQWSLRVLLASSTMKLRTSQCEIF